jgi:two-component system cell cycle response regulator
VGDQVLRQVANVLRANVRASDLLCRFGGEEFVVVLPGTSLDAAVRASEQWREAVAATTTDSGTGTSVACTVSIGLARLNADADESLSSILRRADTALYEAKRAGRNRVVSSEE